MISVIMSTYEEPLEIIIKAIESILVQTYDDIELIVIIDKPDRSDIAGYLKSKNDPRIKNISNKKNMGLTACLNKGIEASKGEYIARMDADDISMPNRLEEQLKYLKKNKCDLVGSDISTMDGNENTITERIVFPKTDKLIKEMLCYNSPLPHPTWLGKASIFHDNSYIDFPACEDYELLVRLALQGKKMGNVNKVLLRYRINDNGISSNKKAVQKTCLSYIRKNYKKNKMSSYGDLIEYLESRRGIRKQKDMKNYYKAAYLINKERGGIRKMICMFRCIPLIINASIGENVYCTIKTRKIRKKA